MFLHNRTKYAAILSLLLLGTAHPSASSLEDDFPQGRKRLPISDTSEERQVLQRTNTRDAEVIRKLERIASRNAWDVMHERGIKNRILNENSKNLMQQIVAEMDNATTQLMEIANNIHESPERRVKACRALMDIFNCPQRLKSDEIIAKKGFPIPSVRVHDIKKRMEYAKLSYSIDNTNASIRSVIMSTTPVGDALYKKLKRDEADQGNTRTAVEILESYFKGKNKYQIDLEKACQYFECLWKKLPLKPIKFKGVDFNVPSLTFLSTPFLESAFSKPDMFQRLTERALESGNINNAIALYLVTAKTTEMPLSYAEKFFDILIDQFDSLALFQNIPLLCQKMHEPSLSITQESSGLFLKYLQFREIFKWNGYLARTLPTFNSNEFINTFESSPVENSREKLSQELTELLYNFILKKHEIAAYDLLCKHGKLISETHSMEDFYNRYSSQNQACHYMIEGLLSSYHNDERAAFNRFSADSDNKSQLMIIFDFIRRGENEKAERWKKLVATNRNITNLDALLQGNIEAAYHTYNFLNNVKDISSLSQCLGNLNKDYFLKLAADGGHILAKIDLAIAKTAPSSAEILEALHLLDTTTPRTQQYTVALIRLYWKLYNRTTNRWQIDDLGLEVMHHVYAKFLSTDEGSLFSCLFHENQEDISPAMMRARVAAASFILQVNPYANISEEDPRYIKALEFQLAHADLTQGLENAYTIHKQLTDARNVPVNLQELASGIGLLTIDANALSNLSNGMEIDTSVLPIIEWTHIAEMLQRLEIKSTDQNANEEIKQALITYSGNESLGFVNLKNIVNGVNEQSYYYMHLKAQKETIQSAQLKCILGYIFSKDNTLNESALSAQEKEFIKIFCQMTVCQTGKEAMIDDYYRNVLHAEYKLVKMKNPSFEQDAIRTREQKILITQALKSILSQETPFMRVISGVPGNRPVNQLSHHTMYLQNLIGPSLGLPDKLRFDPGSLCVSKIMRQMPKEIVIKFFYNYALSGNNDSPLIKEIQRSVNSVINTGTNYMQLSEITSQWTYLDDDNGTPQIKPEGVLELLRFMKIVP